MTREQRARMCVIGVQFARMQVALLFLGCPQRLADDFQVGSLEQPDPLVAPDVSSPEGGAPPVSPGNTPGADAGPPPDQSSASVVGSVPADGASGVLPDAELVLTFSAPMERASVEAAYVSSDLPASDVSFAWSDADRVLRIQPRAPLRTSAGSDPAVVEAVSYSIAIGSGARDAAGNPLVARHISFSTARAISQRLRALTDRDLTGNWRSDGTYGLADCERADTTVCMGDSPSTGEPSYRGFITFDFRQAQSGVLELTAAELSCSIALVYGTPFTSLGALHVDHIAFDLIGDEAFGLAAFPERQSRNTPMNIGDVLAVDVLAAVRSDWSVRDYNQYRLGFETGTDGDGSADQLGCDVSTVALELTYWLP